MNARISWYLVRADGRDDKHCRKWRIVLRFPYDRALKRRPTRSFTADGVSKTEAQRIAQKAASDAEDGKIVAGSAPKVETWAFPWNDSRLAKGVISAETHEKNKNMLAAACMHLGGMKLRDVMPSDIDGTYRALASGDTPSGKPWSGTSLRTLHGVLSCMFSHACAQGLIGRNPVDGVEPPRTDTAERKALTMAQSAALMEKLDCSDPRQWCAWLMLATGMRSEEALAVRFCDLNGNVLYVPRESTKTDAGARAIPLDESTVGAILAHKGDLPDESCIVCDPCGNPLTYNMVRKWWARARAGFGMDGWTLHELRHTFASNLAEADVQPKVMQQLMGHASESTTLRIYTHVHSEQQAKAMDDLARAREKSLEFAKGTAKNQ